MWNFLYTIKCSDVVQSIDAWGKTSVKTEDLVVDECGEGEVVEEVREIFPDIRVSVLSKTLVVEAIDLSDLTGLVISTENGDSRGVSDFEGNK